VFAPRREHARFCCVRCRVTWNREHSADPAAEASVLQWSVTAMTETIERLPMVKAGDRTRAFAAIGEAVWQVTLVDATLVRHHLDAYDGIQAGQAPAQRRLIEQTLAGLRFVRNHIGTEASLGEFIRPGGPGGRQRRITSWTWRPVPDPPVASLAPRGQAWEMKRYLAYQAHLAGQPIGQTFGRAAAFLNLAAARALSITAAARLTLTAGPAPGGPGAGRVSAETRPAGKLRYRCHSGPAEDTQWHLRGMLTAISPRCGPGRSPRSPRSPANAARARDSVYLSTGPWSSRASAFSP